MDGYKAFKLAVSLGGEVDSILRTRSDSRTRIKQPNGRVILIDERGGDMFRRLDDLDAYRVDHDPAHIVISPTWPKWDGSPEWSSRLSQLLEADVHRNADGTSSVVYHRSNGQVTAIGVNGSYLYYSPAHWQDYLKRRTPAPNFLRWD